MDQEKKIDFTVLLVCKSLNISYAALIGKSRKSLLVQARALVCKLLREKKKTLTYIGDCIHRGHSNVISLLRNHDKYKETWEYRSSYDKLSKQQDREFLIEKIEHHEQQIIEARKLLSLLPR